MRYKEYHRLAKLSLQSHKKSTSAIVSGLATGFIILLPLLVVFFGINISANKQLNANPYLLYMEINMSDYRIETDNIATPTSRTLSGSKNIDYFINTQLAKDIIVYEPHRLSSDFEYYTEDNDYKPINLAEFKSYFSIIDLDKSNAFFPNNLIKYFPEGIFNKGYDQGFTGDGKKQVVLSEKMLTRNNLKAGDVYLKKITIRCNNTFEFEKDANTKLSGYLCKDYTVVGIIKNEVSALYEITTSFTPYMYSEMFFTSANVYKYGQGILKPILKNNGTDEYKYLYYENLNEKDFLNEEYMMLGWGQGGKRNSNSTNTIFTTNVHFESDSYKNLNKHNVMAHKHISEIYDDGPASTISTSLTYEKFNSLFEAANILSYLFGIVSLIIVMCSLINLYTTIKHSVEQSRFYLTMLRAIGAYDKAVIKLYLTQSFIISSRANIFVSTIGSVLCIGLKLITDNLLKISKLQYNISIPWHIIIICIISTIALIYALSLTFAFACTYKLSKKSIVSILNAK
jgi:hypothetical protein